MSGKAVPLNDRFWVKVDRSGGVRACWLWTASHNSWGYGRISVNRVSRAAHVVAYEMTHGEVPPGYEVDHLCRNRSCVNPLHLEAVTGAENRRRANAKSHCVAGHPLSGDNVRLRVNGSRRCLACAREWTRNNKESMRLASARYRARRGRAA